MLERARVFNRGISGVFRCAFLPDAAYLTCVTWSSLVSLVTCVLSAQAGVELRSGGVLSRRANNLTPDYRHTINYY